MSNDRKYTMYRKDARGIIEVDLDDPVYSLDQLIEKQKAILDDAGSNLTRHIQGVELYTERVEAEEKVLHRLETARDAARKALGPSRREKTDD